MTRVQIRYRLQKALDESALTAIAGVNAKYGIQKIKVAPGLDSLSVEYDATRLRPAEVEAALAGAGIAILPE
jgi:allophanate hydrolase subunit 1